MFVNVSSFCEPTHPPRQPLHLPRTLCLLADHDQPTAKEPTSPANPVAYPSCLAYYPANRYWVSDHDYITPLPTSRHWLPNHRPPNPPEDPLPPTPPPDIRRDHHPPITGASADIGSPIQLGARTPRLTDGYWRLALPGVGCNHPHCGLLRHLNITFTDCTRSKAMRRLLDSMKITGSPSS